jgi:adenosylhomocysteine nucleosidase
MTKPCLGMVAAMPQEIAPLLKRMRGYRKEKLGGAKLYRFDVQGCEVVLVESGMGPRRAAAATEALISAASPKAILNFGFAGGVLPGLKVTDLVLAERVLMLKEGKTTEAPQTDDSLSAALLEALKRAGLPVRSGTFITAATIMNKAEVAGSLAAGLRGPVLEMETAAIFSAAHAAGIPALALRGISDAADEELGFSLEEFCDADLNISIGRVIRCVAGKPWIIPQLLRLSANTKRAGETLALGVEAALKALCKV